ncbi:Phytochrome A-associated F-box protein [Acorus calamus]|uniref:Phytochrome A-associated F-box protein n=1 Tax=Acorus calamus TaxID=4465 RepID=A0AAV9ERT3_ACOCL|nr:Phytochrome A-associated F-box protein [Acorus calamus]
MAAASSDPGFGSLSDDIVLNILVKLEHDPRDWSRLACVCARFSSLVRNVCWRNKCSSSAPSDLLPSPPSGGWSALHKLSVCCPGLLRAGVLLENSDFGLEREIGPDEDYNPTTRDVAPAPVEQDPAPPSDCWSLFDDLYFDTVYDASESGRPIEASPSPAPPVRGTSRNKKRRRTDCGSVGTHLASSGWNLNREQGNKLLASRFRGDCLYICDWPGCVHKEEKRKYMLFRGVFKDFKKSRVWRTINDGNRSRIALDCAFCACRETWDLHSAFCLRRVFGYHDDGEPVVRAYVCENGHVSGAWTERPMYA